MRLERALGGKEDRKRPRRREAVSSVTSGWGSRDIDFRSHLLVPLTFRMGTDGIKRVQIYSPQHGQRCLSAPGKGREVQAPDLTWLEILTRFQGRKGDSG